MIVGCMAQCEIQTRLLTTPNLPLKNRLPETAMQRSASNLHHLESTAPAALGSGFSFQPTIAEHFLHA
jgi:hypothetical protein